MKTQRRIATRTAVAVVVLVWLWVAPAAAAPLLLNGGFEAGLTGWRTVDAPGGDGTFYLQAGTVSPASGEIVPAPPGGVAAAMSDSLGPGAHVLFQDFLVPASVDTATLAFDLFIGNRAELFFTPSPPTLEYDIPDLNQQARVDILRAGTDPFSVEPSDVLLNVFQTHPGTPPLSGYTTFSVSLTGLLAANAGQTLRLRFAETDNVFTFQLGVDNVGIDVQAVPEPATLVLLATGLASAGLCRRRRVWTAPRVQARPCTGRLSPLR